jgi:RHS repeat-associated protein
MGQLVAEYASDPPPTNGGGLSYLTTDVLGSPRIITDVNGMVRRRHDYRPFGEEIMQYEGGRGSVPDYNGGDNLRQKFTGYERDGETGLDYAQTRYFASTHGRFTSPDLLLASGRVTRPQTWNRYTYSLNNPLRYTDPTGMISKSIMTLDEVYQEQQQERSRKENSTGQGVVPPVKEGTYFLDIDPSQPGEEEVLVIPAKMGSQDIPSTQEPRTTGVSGNWTFPNSLTLVFGAQLDRKTNNLFINQGFGVGWPPGGSVDVTKSWDAPSNAASLNLSGSAMGLNVVVSAEVSIDAAMEAAADTLEGKPMNLKRVFSLNESHGFTISRGMKPSASLTLESTVSPQDVTRMKRDIFNAFREVNQWIKKHDSIYFTPSPGAYPYR